MEQSKGNEKVNRKESRGKERRMEGEKGKRKRERKNGNGGFSNTSNVLNLGSDSKSVCRMIDTEICIL